MLHILKKHWKTRAIPWLLAFFVFVSSLIPAFGQEVLLHEYIESFPVTGGVIYESKTLFTSKGWQKVHILRADLTSENVDIDTMIGKEGLSKRASLSSMVQDNGAVAGINGDFFIMATPSAPIGPQIKNGKLVSSSLNLNDMSTIGMTFDRIPQILNMEFTGKVIAPNGNEFEIEGVNKIRNSYNKIFVYTPDFGSTTPRPADGSPIITFVTVRDDRVSGFAEGTIENIPEDGFILMSWGEGATFLKTHFTIGDRVITELNTTPDISNLKMALGGGAVLVDGGSIPEAFTHDVPGTHPRTAIGFTADKKTMIMAVVDGRQSQSRGMNQREMAELMLGLGAHHALNFDGGGSSTMVVRPFGETQTKVINSPSEGVQRLIPNGIGVFSKAPLGKVSGLIITASSFNIAKGGHRTFQVKAYDKNYNIVDIESGQVEWSVSDNLGYFTDNIFTATNSGTGQVVATLGNIKATKDIHVLADNARLQVEPAKAQVNLGAKTAFETYITDSEGYKAPLESIDVNWNIVGDIGVMDGSKFTAKKPGSGAVVASFLGLEAGALIQAGYHSVIIDDFEDLSGKAFDSYPSYVEGAFNITPIPDPVHSGDFAGRLIYDFTSGTDTRAAYLTFGNNGKVLPLNATKLGLWVYGRGQGEWLRMALLDASGKETVLDLTKKVDWNNWQWVEVPLPSGKAPFTLKTIYVVENDPKKKTSGALYFDGLTAQVALEYDESLLPTPVWTDIYNRKGSGFVFGAIGTKPVTGKNRPEHDKIFDLAKRILNENNSDFNAIVGIPWSADKLEEQLSPLKNYKISGKGYSLHLEKEASFIFLDATKGSLRATDYNQWVDLKNDLKTLDKSKALFIVMDRAPESFSDPLEGNLLKNILEQYAKSFSPGIWVLSGESSPFRSRAIEGVHYINIPSIDSNEPAVVLFNISEGEISYQVVPIIEKIYTETVGVKAGVATNLKVYGVTPANDKIPLGYPYVGEWNISYDKPTGFDSKTLAFKAVEPGTALAQVRIGNMSHSFHIQITDISVLVNGKEVLFPDQVPYINENSRTMVPVRFVSEGIGAKVEWDSDNRMVIIEKDDTIIKLKIGENKADVNGKTVTFDTNAILQNDRTMVPVRFISETLGANVDWDQATKTVSIDI